MKFLVISDLHAANDVLDKMDSIFAEADGVLFAGDFAECFKPESGQDALKKLCSKHDSIFAVLGNCDNEDFLEDLDQADICVQKALVFHEGISFAGSGGATYFTGKTEFERSEEEILSDFDIVSNAVADTGDASLWASTLLISHNPPKDCKCDAVNPELHVGSQLFREFIQEKQPLAVICGHVHEAAAIDSIGNTLIMNPGSLAEGKYGWLELVKNDNGDWSLVAANLATL